MNALNTGVTPIDASGSTSATAGTATTILAANTSRGGLVMTNTSNSVIFVSDTGTATSASLPIYPQQTYEWSYVPVSAISAICIDQASATFILKYYNGTPATGLINGGLVAAGVQPMANSLSSIAAPRPSAVSSVNTTVGTSSSILIPLNLLRSGFELYNNGSATIFLSFGTAAAVLNQGIPVVAGGQYYNPASTLTTNDVRAISSVAAQNVTYVEYL
jgi:hypothetical protein